MKKECRIYQRQLERTFPDLPPGIAFAIKSFVHDFGIYVEVCIYFDDDDEQQIDYACRVECSPPKQWDDEALTELKEISGYRELCG